jgi:coenzyme F420 hydrogenase subunit beta
MPYTGDEIGPAKDVFMARSKDRKMLARAQYGGVVTTLLAAAIEQGMIGKAFAAKSGKDKLPAAEIASTPAEVLACAGSNYMAYPALEALNRVRDGDKEKHGIVVTPCQALALSKMRLNPPAQRAGIANVALAIGLFCTWALSYDGFYRFLKANVALPKVKKFDIPPPPANRLDIYERKTVTSFSLDQIRDFRMPSCAYCLDMTAELADVSIGAVEGVEGWNTVIVRMGQGADILQAAVKKGLLETKTLPPAILAHLREASLNKKARAMKEIIKRTGDKKNLLYLVMADDVRERLTALDAGVQGGH